MIINGFFLFAAVTVIGFYLLDLIANLMNLKALKPQLPREFEDTYDAEAYAKSQNYTRTTTRFGLVDSAFSLVVFLAFWWMGGFEWLDQWVRGFEWGPIATGIAYIFILMFGAQLLYLPFSIYNTFVIEERYGFNKTTPKVFISDAIKGILISLVLGIPLLALILYLFGHPNLGDTAWLYAWVITATFNLILVFLAPKIILPMFNKLEPLPEGELKSAIFDMAQTCDYPVAEIYEMDGSKRSTKSNAFFTGFGKTKKIALFDTLIKNHSVKELVAVLAHEIGHFKKKHIMKTMVLGILQMGIIFWLLGLFLNNRALFDAFGMSQISVYGSLIFFFILLSPIRKILGILMSLLSRQHEFEADAFAANVTGEPVEMVRALKNLSKDNLVNLTPHPFYVFINYSHPPMLERINALRTMPQH